jgi:hypothetical protein
MAKKYQIILLLMLSLQVRAMPNVALEKNTSDGIFQLAIFNKDKSWQLSTNTNEFGQNKLQGVGLYGIKNMASQQDQIKIIEKFYEAINRIDETLRGQGKSFADLNQVDKHATYLKIGKYQIDQSHPYYKELYEALSKLITNVELDKNNVAELSFGEKGPQVSYFKNNKTIKSESYSMNFNCKQRGSKKLCTIEKYGDLFIE